eukprot:3533598-Pleurochrysis_carterae.AAC.1
MRTLGHVSIGCHISEGFLEWTLPQHVDEKQSERTLIVLGECGFGENTLLWMKQQFAIFLDAPSSEPERVYEYS